MKSIGFIDYYLDEWHANNYPAWISKTAGDKMKVSCAWAQIDSPIGGMSNAEWCGKHGVTLCKTPGEVVEKSDYLIVLSPDDPDRHEVLCVEAFASGKPVYVDKTFAPDYKTAVRLANMAERGRSPFFTSSALRFADEYTGMEASGIAAIATMGGGDYINYLVHQIEPIVMLMNARAKRVMCTGALALPAFVVEFEDSRRAHITVSSRAPFAAAIKTEKDGDRFISVQSDFFSVFIARMCEFFENNEPLFPLWQTLEIMAIRESCCAAIVKTDQWIDVPGA